MAVLSIALDQVSVVLRAIYELENEHLNEDEGCVDRREDPLDSVLASIAVLIGVIGVCSHGLKHNSIRASSDFAFDKELAL